MSDEEILDFIRARVESSVYGLAIHEVVEELTAKGIGEMYTRRAVRQLLSLRKIRLDDNLKLSKARR